MLLVRLRHKFMNEIKVEDGIVIGNRYDNQTIVEHEIKRAVADAFKDHVWLKPHMPFLYFFI